MNLITASHDEKILAKNLAASGFYKTRTPSTLKVMKGFNNIPTAYNLATKLCDPLCYNIYVHQDVFLPLDFQDNLCNAIANLNKIDNNWGVIGCVGAAIENGKRIFPGYVKDRGRDWGDPKDLPKEVQTLDELLLITRGDFEFDPQFDLHFYGADICLASIKEGRKNYAINCYCHHNSSLPYGYKSESFYECEKKFREKWKDVPLITTTCSLIENETIKT